MTTEEQTPEEIAEDERLAAIARGDIVEEEELEEEELEEEELEEEEEAESDDELDEEEEEEPITIPKARFDEVQSKARAREAELQARLDKMEAEQYKVTDAGRLTELENDIETKQDEYEDLLMEGELEKARVVRREVNQMQKSLSDSRLLQQSQQASQTAVEQMRFDTQLARFEADHPVINPDSDDFSEETANEVAEMLQAFKATGLTATAALNKAMHYVLPSDNYQQVQDPDIVRSKRSQAARRKVAKVAKKSPPSLKDTGRDSGKHGADDGLPDITHMDMDDFDKLPEKTKKAMRGDSLA